MTYNTLGNYIDNSLISNAFGFLRLPLNFYPYNSDAEWVITGIPFDIATSGRAGSRGGPAAIRQVSTNLAWEKQRWPWNFCLNEYLKIIDCGDLVFSIGDANDMCKKLQLHIEKLLESNKRCLTFGGDHFITLPLLRSHYKYFGKMALVHFDAHSDTNYNTSKYDHGSMFYHAPIEGLIDPAHSIQIGIRTEFCCKHNFKVLDIIQINNMHINEVLNEIKKTVGKKPVYLTFDIDCLDPSYAPGTGTQVVGGLTSDYALKLVRGLQTLNIIGMDLVEVAPIYDKSEITALVAATIALEMLYIQASKKIK
ncbi:Agmatinase [Candidatus Providencia siddallii]|uniref:Agmatinase n=1 Tax=Candidatus Providencia siddallii TaxID=1715285 RepID=A0A0M6W6U3_9GAMM|nr:Agmatinase [Candidatus Providencia siddallii]